MTHIPRDPAPDSTWALMREGYEFVPTRCERFASDFFEARVLMERTLFMRGREATRLFYDTDRFTRKNAAPRRLQKSLFGVAGIQSLDGSHHRQRKALFLSLLTAEGLEELVARVDAEWRQSIESWQHRERVVLLDEVEELLCRAVCEWAGIPVDPSEVPERTKQLAWLFEGSIMVGPRYWRARAARRRAEKWAAGLIRSARARGRADERALRRIAHHREPDGTLLKPRVAAVELLNVLRPTVAISRYVVFEALALHRYPTIRQRIADGEEELIEAFVQEVRRYYPFFPMVAARVRHDFEWQGVPLPAGRRVMLDLYGTDHHPDIWEDPEVFRPERFRAWPGDAFELIPQGGGDHRTNHRCPGEWITMELMKLAARHLTSSITYDVPAQDLRVRLSHIPAEPRSRLILRAVRRVAPSAEARPSPRPDLHWT